MSRPEATLDLVIVSDLRAGAHVKRSGPFRIEAHDWNELPAKLAVELPSLGLRFSSLRDFRPESLAEKMPSVRSLLDVTRLLADVKSGRGGQDALRAAAAAAGLAIDASARAAPGAPASPTSPPPSPTSAQAAPLSSPPAGSPTKSKQPGGDESIFDLIDLAGTHTPTTGGPSETASAAQRGLEGLLGSMFGPTVPDRAHSAADLAALDAEVDREIARRLQNVLHDPAFRACEAGWSGVRFLCRRLDFRSGVRLYALPVSRDELPAAWGDHLAPFVEEQQAESRTVCVLLDFPFDPTEKDLSLLAEIGARAERQQVPVLAPLAPERLQSNLSDPMGDARQEWERFRLADEARWVALAANRFLLRLPYGAAADAVRGFRFEETIAANDDLLWGGTHWLLAAAVTSSFAQTGWGTDLTSARTGGLVEDLAVTAIPNAGGETVTSPLEHLPSESAALRWIRDGLAAVVGRRDTDQALIAGAPVAHRAEQTLSQRLFEAQVYALARSISRFTDPSKAPADVAATLAAGLNFLASSPAGALFRAAVEPERSGGAAAASGSPNAEVSAAAPAFALRITPDLPPLRGLDSFALRIDRD